MTEKNEAEEIEASQEIIKCQGFLLPLRRGAGYGKP